MKKVTLRQEKGQILVLFVLGLIGLLGFTALAIDGGMIYADRRYDQSVADSAALAGGAAASKVMESGLPGDPFTVRTNNFSCGSLHLNKVRNAAINAATSRVEDNSTVLVKNVTVQCADAGNDPYVDIIVDIESDTQTNFAQIVFDEDSVHHTVQSTVRVRPRSALALGYAIVGLNPGMCSGNDDGVTFSGSSVTLVSQAGILANGCLRTNGGGSANVTPASEGIYYCAENRTSDEDLNPDAEPCPGPAPTPNPDLPVCPATAGGVDPATGHYKPGVYAHGLSAGSNTILDPGLYCFDADLRVNSSGDKLTGNGVTLYFRGSAGLTVNGGYVNIKAAENNPTNGAIRGMLIMMAPGNSSTISMEGNGDSHYSGTVFAPESQIFAGGDQNNSTEPKYYTQFIGNNVKITGGANLQIVYDQSKLYENPSYLDQYR